MNAISAADCLASGDCVRSHGRPWNRRVAQCMRDICGHDLPEEDIESISRYAQAIGGCGVFRDREARSFPCKNHKACNHCNWVWAIKRAEDYKVRVAAVLGEHSNARIYFATLTVPDASELHQSFARFRKALSGLRKKQRKANGVLSDVSVLEPAIGSRLPWYLHAHVLLVVDPAQFAPMQLRGCWIKMTRPSSHLFSRRKEFARQDAQSLWAYGNFTSGSTEPVLADAFDVLCYSHRLGFRDSLAHNCFSG